ncbi:MAG: glutamate-1-semialdehyde 2,1-aminomutase [Bacillota bacterium]|uniref:glutamate-1-semialdehyde 2,1-aminomutase n=1 Tax=Desulfurispora thermophila TaxID=265470 RepID=UPI00037751E4|nr:glutamate-1-semialdehyde 2,1-aminomutase [Desulfurispora thermophila]
MQDAISRQLFAEAARYMPGGVNSPVRAFRAVGRDPVFIKRGQGALLYDEDGNVYIDYVNSWGPLILGHRHPAVVAAIQDCLEIGTSFGAPTRQETELARLIVEAVPSIEMVRLVNSGTEATMSALRLARAYTKRDKIIKFAGCYHGHADMLLIKAGSGALTHGVPTSPGVPAAAAADTIVAPFNNLSALEEIFARVGEQIAAVIVEPVPGNMGLVPPRPGFLAGLRELTTRYGALLIFDEVITGFRLGWGGAQAYYGVLPDLTCLGKIIGGGLPVGAYGGRQEIMSLVSPAGPVYQAGTLSGNPLAVSAGLATLKVLQQPGVYEELERKAALLAGGLKEAARSAGVPVYWTRVGSMLCGFFTEQTVVDYDTALTADTRRYAVYFQAMLEQGIYLAPAQFEATFVCTAHTDEQIEHTVAAARVAMQRVAELEK